MSVRNNVLLLYPKTGVNPNYPQPPLSLLSLGPYIKEEGLTPVIIDQRVDKNHIKEIQKELPRSLFVGITSMTGEQIRYALELIDFIKKVSPGTPVVFGGIHASLLPEQLIEHPSVDMVAVGEGESVIADIISHFRDEREISTVKGIYFKKNGKIFSTSGRSLLDLETLKIPLWSIIDRSKYSDFGIQCGRGCPYQCSFCYNLKYNHGKWRFRNPASILEEIRFLNLEYKIDDIMFLDDNFFTNFERVKELCNLIIKSKIKINWSTTCRADCYKKFSPEFIKTLKESGMQTLFVGAESGSPSILKRINKSITVDDIVSMAEVTKKHKLHTVISFMTGFPFETAKDRFMSYDMMDRITTINPDLDVNGINIYTPYPGNDLFEESVKHYNLIKPLAPSGWSTYVFNMSNLPWLSGSENRKLENISFITRFYFWRRELRKRFIKFHYYPFYLFLRASAVIRWKFRFFTAAFEWDMFRIIRKNFLE